MTSTPAVLDSCVHRMDGVTFTVAVHEVYTATRRDGAAVLRTVISSTSPGQPHTWLIAERPICRNVGRNWAGLHREYATFAALDADRAYYPPDYPHPHIRARPGRQIQQRIELLAEAAGSSPVPASPARPGDHLARLPRARV